MSLRHKLKIWYYHKFKHYDDAAIRRIQLIKNGAHVGEQTYIFSDMVESSEPYLIEIGNDVIIAPDVRFYTHDASAKYYIDGASDLFGRIKIGDHCFIGGGVLYFLVLRLPKTV